MTNKEVQLRLQAKRRLNTIIVINRLLVRSALRVDHLIAFSQFKLDKISLDSNPIDFLIYVCVCIVNSLFAFLFVVLFC